MINQKTLGEIDLSELFQKKKNNNSYTEKTLATLFDVYITGAIGEAEDYLELFDKIRNAGENDFIKLHINSPGGYLSTATQFLRCLQETRASVIASVEGECSSAATILLLAASSFEVSDHSTLLFHTFSSGMGGKGNELRERSKFDSSWSEKYFHDIYKDFLSKEEIDQLLEGKDFWFDADETIERLKKREELRIAAEEKPKVKKAKTKVSKKKTVVKEKVS